jgi:hypothetical protein
LALSENEEYESNEHKFGDLETPSTLQVGICPLNASVNLHFYFFRKNFSKKNKSMIKIMSLFKRRIFTEGLTSELSTTDLVAISAQLSTGHSCKNGDVNTLARASTTGIQTSNWPPRFDAVIF